MIDNVIIGEFLKRNGLCPNISVLSGKVILITTIKKGYIRLSTFLADDSTGSGVPLGYLIVLSSLISDPITV